MAVFSTNQNRHLYVVTGIKSPGDLKAYVNGVYPDETKKGHTALTIIPAHDNPAYGAPGTVTTMQNADAFEFLYVNAIGEITHSDIIWKHSIRSIRKTPASAMRKNLLTKTITFDPASALLTDGTTTTNNSVCYLNFSFPGFQNATDEEVMTKVVSFPYKNGDNWGDNAKAAIEAAFKPNHNLYNNLVKVSAYSQNSITIYAPEGGPYIKGQHTNKPTRMEISGFTIEIFDDQNLNTIPGSNDYRVREAGTVADATTPAGFISNARVAEDLEWFCMGERGDQYRLAAFPNQINTPYMLPMQGVNEYDMLDIQYYFQGEGTRSDKSEKHITLVAAADGTNGYNSNLQYFYDIICGGNTTSVSLPDEDYTPDGGEVGTPVPPTGPTTTEPTPTDDNTQTPENPDTATTQSATEVTASSAVLHGTASGTGTVSFVYWPTNDAQNTTTVSSPTNDGSGNYSATVSNLTAQTGYSYKIVVGTTEGNVVTFTTEE